MILSYMELLYLAAYWILLYEYVVMRHTAICAESDDYIYQEFLIDMYEQRRIPAGQELYWNRGTK